MSLEFDGPGGTTRGVPVEFKAAAAETASTTHATFDTGPDGGSLVVKVAVTAAAGTTPTLLVVVEGSEDGGTTWVTLGEVGASGYTSGSVATAPSNFTVAAVSTGFFPKPQQVRTRSVVGGTTPSFTYSVEGVLS